MKNSIGFIVAAVVFVGMAACGTAQSTDDGPPTVREVIVQTFFGEGDNLTAEAALSRPGAIVVDHKGFLLVADGREATARIKIFDPSGSFVENIATNGEAPGEIRQATAMGIVDGRLVVEDEQAQRMTWFDEEYGNPQTHPTNDNEMLWPRQFHDLGDGRFIGLYKMPNERWMGGFVEASSHLGHIFEPGNPVASHRIIPKERSAGMASDFVDYTTQLNPGALDVTSSGDVFYAPYLYEGRLYRYEPTSDSTWAESVYEQGAFLERPSYTHLGTFDESIENAPERARQIHSGGVVNVGFVLTETIGLFVEDDVITHFYIAREPYDRTASMPIIYMSEYDVSGGLRATYQLENEFMDPEFLRTIPVIPFQIPEKSGETYYMVSNRLGRVMSFRIGDVVR